MKMQGPAIQGLMSRYLEQSASAFMDMQQQLQQQTRNLFGSFPFPNFGARRSQAAVRQRQRRRRHERLKQLELARTPRGPTAVPFALASSRS